MMIGRDTGLAEVQKSSGQNWIVFGLILIFTEELIRTAWISDDAAITLRCVLNFIHGYGLTFNVDERVQAFTHPLWCLLLSGSACLLKDIFLCTWVLSILSSLITLWGLLRCFGENFYQSVVAVTVLLCSKAYIDFSTSGLENPLSHLTILAALWLAIKAIDALQFKRITYFFLSCSFVYLTRPDLILLLLPVMTYLAYVYFERRALSLYRIVQSCCIGMMPAVIWTLFSLYYYGSPFPNTAYAKLGAGMSREVLISQGLNYMLDSLSRDPLTLSFIALGIVLGICKHVFERCIAFGILLYFVYIIVIGGDFMSGRYFTVPLLLASVLFSRARILTQSLTWITVGIALLALFSMRSNFIASDHRAENATIPTTGIADERAFYFHGTSLFAYPSHIHIPRWTIKNRTMGIQCGGIGLEGLQRGPGAHLVDICGLADPLLARMKAKPYVRIGHYYRNIPAGYGDSLRTNSNRLQEPELKKLYDTIRLLTRGPLNSKERLLNIVRFNLGYK